MGALQRFPPGQASRFPGQGNRLDRRKLRNEGFPLREIADSLPDVEELTADEPPQGPKDGYADKSAIEAIAKWYREVLEEERASASVAPSAGA